MTSSCNGVREGEGEGDGTAVGERWPLRSCQSSGRHNPSNFSQTVLGWIDVPARAHQQHASSERSANEISFRLPATDPPQACGLEIQELTIRMAFNEVLTKVARGGKLPLCAIAVVVLLHDVPQPLRPVRRGVDKLFMTVVAKPRRPDREIRNFRKRFFHAAQLATRPLHACPVL